MPDFLNAYLHVPAQYGFPPHFHLALAQGWYVARAQGMKYADDAHDLFLRDYLLGHLRDAKAALFLSDALITYLNTPSPSPSLLPFTRFMTMIYDALGPAARQFDRTTMQGCIQFYHAFIGELASAYYFPVELMPSALLDILRRAQITAPPAKPPLCRILREADFLAPAGFETEVTLVGPADLENGLGAALRYMAEGLKAVPVNFSIFNKYGNSGSRAADSRYSIFETRQPRSPINILHFNSDMLAENLLTGGPENFSRRYAIGYFLWETSQLSLAHKLGIELVDEIWVSTEFMRQLYSSETSKPVFLCGAVIEPPAVTLPRTSLPVPPGSMDSFTFAFTYDSASRATRKNPRAVVEAFKKAFQNNEKVSLLIKTQNAERLGDGIEKELYAELVAAAVTDPRIHLINATWKAAEVATLLAACDCYISLHRAEGLGYGMAEAMYFGVPVIATGWSGNADFITESTAYPAPSRLVKIKAGDYHYADENAAQPHYWAEPDVDKAAELMHYVFTHPEETEARGAAGQNLIRSIFSAAAVGKRMKDRLNEIMAMSLS